MNRIIDILWKSYGIKATQVSTLVGYVNNNYKITDAEGVNYVLKEFEFDQLHIDFIEAECEVLKHLAVKYPGSFPEVIQISEGKNYIIDQKGDKKYVYRLLSWLDGRFVADVDQNEKLSYSFGEFLAKMDLQFLQLDNPVIKSRRIEWDIQYLPDYEDRILHIKDVEIKKLVHYFLVQYKENVLPALPKLRKSIIHNDTNDYNVLALDGSISGVIDFGDMVYAPLINELAVGITYLLFNKENPLQTASIVLKPYHRILPLRSEEVDLLYYIIAGRLCLSLMNSAHSSRNEPDNKYITVSEKGAMELLKKWITINPVKAKQAFREAIGIETEKQADVSECLNRRHQVLSKAQSVSYSNPIWMNRAAFQYMYDVYGNTYLDAYNNIPHVGHQHPKVVEAGQRQMARLNTNTRYLYDNLADYAERLLDTFPENLNKVFFVNSGSAASDLAIRMAQTHTQWNNLMVVEHGYHGHTRLGIDISHYKFGGKGGKGQAAYIVKATIPDTFRGIYKNNDGTAGKQYANQALEMLNDQNDSIAAFIAEPIVGCAGQVPLALDYLKNLYPEIRKRGGVCISDEVQTGFGRMGSAFWGFELQEVVPDIVILGKPMANGHPMGAVVTTTEIADSFDNGMEFFSSFGGNPVSCDIAKSVLEVIDEEALQQNALSTGRYFLQLLSELKAKYPVIGDVRGNGLFLGIEFVKDPDTLEYNTELANYIKNEMRERFILVSTDGPGDNIIKMKPPLCFSKDNALQGVEAMDQIISKYST